MPEEVILIRYHQGEATSEEAALVKQWLEASEEHQEEFKTLVAIWEHSAGASMFQEIDIAADWAKLQAKRGDSAKIKPLQTRPTWQKYWWVAAVVVLLAVIGGIRFWENRQAPAPQYAQTSPTDTPKQFTLPDGSVVWLNADSKLEYPEKFSGKERMVRLAGEAFFEVISDPNQPFVVQTSHSRTEVLGTKFNVQAYSKMYEAVVFVEEGRVRFSSTTADQESIELTAGEHARIDRSGKIQSIEGIGTNVFSWKTNRLEFEETELERVLLIMSAHYKVIPAIDGMQGANCLITNVWENTTLEEALQELEVMVGLQYTFEEERNVLQVTGANCQNP